MVVENQEAMYVAQREGQFLWVTHSIPNLHIAHALCSLSRQLKFFSSVERIRHGCPFPKILPPIGSPILVNVPLHV